jgi:hypothetical protein
MAERVEMNSGQNPDLAAHAGVTNVLLLAPSLGEQSTETCFELLTQSPPAQTNVLTVTYTQSPGAWVADWNAHAGGHPARGGIVSVGELEADIDDPRWAVREVETPSDLTGVGIELSELLSGIATAAAEDEHIAVCFDSITSLLQYAELQRAFRFLHVVTARVKTVDGVGHFHLDPDAHDQQTLATLKGLFDAVVEVDGSGDWTLQT